jgi:hypothetical protein
MWERVKGEDFDSGVGFDLYPWSAGFDPLSWEEGPSACQSRCRWAGRTKEGLGLKWNTKHPKDRRHNFGRMWSGQGRWKCCEDHDDQDLWATEEEGWSWQSQWESPWIHCRCRWLFQCPCRWKYFEDHQGHDR